MTRESLTTSPGVPSIKSLPWSSTITFSAASMTAPMDVFDPEDRQVVPVPEVADEFDRLHDLLGVEASEHFVQQEQLRPGGKRPRDLEPLFLHHVEVPRFDPGQVPEPDHREIFARAFPPVSPVFRPGAVDRRHSDVFQAGHRGKRTRNLKSTRDTPHAHLVCRKTRDVHPVEEYPPAVGFVRPGHQVEQGRLTGPVRPDQPRDGSPPRW